MVLHIEKCAALYMHLTCTANIRMCIRFITVKNHAITVLVCYTLEDLLGSVDISILLRVYHFMGLILLHMIKPHLVQGLIVTLAIHTHGQAHVSVVITLFYASLSSSKQ